MLKQIEETVIEASKIFHNKVQERDVSLKSSFRDLVTIYDKMVQDFLYKKFSVMFPTVGFLGEEKLNKPGKDGTLIIDPIDGTLNFVKGFSHSAISIGYIVDGQMQLGVVYDPYKKEMFSAERGKGATLNGQRIHVMDLPLDQSVALVGTAVYNQSLCKPSFDLMYRLQQEIMDIRRFGTASLDFCDVACGRANMFFEYELAPWDIAAGSLIAEEAGAIVSDMEGKPLQFESNTSIAIATPSTYDDLMRVIKAK